MPTSNRLMPYFTFTHLPEELQAISKPFCLLARKLDRMIAKSELNADEGQVALRKLLEAKDAAVRAAL